MSCSQMSSLSFLEIRIKAWLDITFRRYQQKLYREDAESGSQVILFSQDNHSVPKAHFAMLTIVDLVFELF